MGLFHPIPVNSSSQRQADGHQFTLEESYVSRSESDLDLDAGRNVGIGVHRIGRVGSRRISGDVLGILSVLQPVSKADALQNP